MMPSMLVCIPEIQSACRNLSWDENTYSTVNSSHTTDPSRRQDVRCRIRSWWHPLRPARLLKVSAPHGQ